MARRREPSTESDNRWSPVAVKALVCVGVLLGLAVGSPLLWRYFGSRFQSDQNAQLTTESFDVTPQPPWIRSDVRAEAVRDGSLTQLTFDLYDLTARVDQAFLMHSWVENVRYVSKRYPGKIIVELEYRKPVAMVEVQDPAGNRGLFPVDAEGIFLPPGDFMPDSHPTVPVDSYPRIRSDGLYPSGPPGTPWGDIRVARGAKLASYLAPYWQRLGLLEIVAIRGRRNGADPGVPTFDLRTPRNTVVLWGHAPGDEPAGEATPDKKLAQLLDFIQQKGTLDALQPDQTIDVRHIDGLEIATVGRQVR